MKEEELEIFCNKIERDFGFYAELLVKKDYLSKEDEIKERINKGFLFLQGIGFSLKKLQTFNRNFIYQLKTKVAKDDPFMFLIFESAGKLIQQHKEKDENQLIDFQQMKLSNLIFLSMVEEWSNLINSFES